MLEELEHIRNEISEEKKCMEHKKQKEDLKLKEVELIHGNTLLNPTHFNVKMRWEDDVVYRNQTRDKSKVPKRFINDTIINYFHHKSLHKHMK